MPENFKYNDTNSIRRTALVWQSSGKLASVSISSGCRWVFGLGQMVKENLFVLRSVEQSRSRRRGSPAYKGDGIWCMTDENPIFFKNLTLWSPSWLVASFCVSKHPPAALQQHFLTRHVCIFFNAIIQSYQQVDINMLRPCCWVVPVLRYLRNSGLNLRCTRESMRWMLVMHSLYSKWISRLSWILLWNFLPDSLRWNIFIRIRRRVLLIYNVCLCLKAVLPWPSHKYIKKNECQFRIKMKFWNKN